MKPDELERLVLPMFEVKPKREDGMMKIFPRQPRQPVTQKTDTQIFEEMLSVCGGQRWTNVMNALENVTAFVMSAVSDDAAARFREMMRSLPEGEIRKVVEVNSKSKRRKGEKQQHENGGGDEGNH